MPGALSTARQARPYLAPRFSRPFYRFVRMVGGLYLRLLQGVRDVRVSGMDDLYAAISSFQRGESRLLILFRHVAVADGPVVLDVIIRRLSRWARRHRRPLHDTLHAHFLYGRDVLNWAGWLARVTFPRMGGIPVINGRVDKVSLGEIRDVLAGGRFPLALAPEAQVTYHQFHCFDPVAGAATLAGWAHRDLAVSGASRVEIVPVALGYSYGRRAWSVLRKAIGLLERALDTDPSPPPGTLAEARTRLARLTERTLAVLESMEPFRPSGKREPGSMSFGSRLGRLCDAALRQGERAAGLRSSGSCRERIFRLRHWIERNRHRDDVRLSDLGPLERALADRRAALASGVRPYERIADVLSYLTDESIPVSAADTGSYGADAVPEPSEPSAVTRDRLVEYALNLLDVVNRATGGDIDTRPELGKRTAVVLIGRRCDASALLAGGDSRHTGTRELNREIGRRLDELTRRLAVQVWPAELGSDRSPESTQPGRTRR